MSWRHIVTTVALTGVLFSCRGSSPTVPRGEKRGCLHFPCRALHTLDAAHQEKNTAAYCIKLPLLYAASVVKTGVHEACPTGRQSCCAVRMCITKSTSVCCSAQAVVSKITVDQLISAPLGTAVFFTSMKWLEGRSNEIKSTIEVRPLSDNSIVSLPDRDTGEQKPLRGPQT